LKLPYICFLISRPVRFVFAYAGVEYEDVRLPKDDTWAEAKKTFTWGTVPVLEVDGQQLGQSNAILRYVAKKHNLAGDNDFESAKADEMVEAMNDLKKAAFAPFYEKDEAKKEELVATFKNETVPKYFKVWEKVLESNGGKLVGNNFTYADFSIASYIDVINDLNGGKLLEGFPALKSHFDSVFAARGIKDHVAKRPKTQF